MLTSEYKNMFRYSAVLLKWQYSTRRQTKACVDEPAKLKLDCVALFACLVVTPQKVSDLNPIRPGGGEVPAPISTFANFLNIKVIPTKCGHFY